MKRPKNYYAGQELKVNPIHPVIGEYLTPVLRCVVSEYQEKSKYRDDCLIIESLDSKEYLGDEDGLAIEEYVIGYVGSGETSEISPSYIEEYDLKEIASQMARKDANNPLKVSGELKYNDYIKERDRLSKVYFQELAFLIDEPVFVPAYFLEARTEPTLPEI